MRKQTKRSPAKAEPLPVGVKTIHITCACGRAIEICLGEKTITAKTIIGSQKPTPRIRAVTHT